MPKRKEKAGIKKKKVLGLLLSHDNLDRVLRIGLSKKQIPMVMVW